MNYLNLLKELKYDEYIYQEGFDKRKLDNILTLTYQDSFKFEIYELKVLRRDLIRFKLLNNNLTVNACVDNMIQNLEFAIFQKGR